MVTFNVSVDGCGVEPSLKIEKRRITMSSQGICFNTLRRLVKWNVSDCKSCDHKFEEFFFELLFILHECFPVSTVKAGKFSKSWINQELHLLNDYLKGLYWRLKNHIALKQRLLKTPLRQLA